MKCPNCQNNMVEIQYESANVDVCQSCGGVWLDEGEIATIVKDKTKQFSPAEKLVAVASKGQDRLQASSLKCPKCSSPMTITQYAYNSGIFIDRCPSKHGVWMDQGELERLQVVMDEMDLHTKPVSKKSLREIPHFKSCPLDGTRMAEISSNDETLDQCPKCKGIWCDETELHELLNYKTSANPIAQSGSRGGSQAAPNVLATKDLMSDLKCVVCHNPLVKANYAYSSGVVIDRCRDNHGVWLDSGELEKVQTFTHGLRSSHAAVMPKFSLLLDKATRTGSLSYDKSIQEGRNKVLQSTYLGRFVRMISGR